MGKVIAIDGPAGSGKGTVAKLLAQKLGYINIDTGATYRCVALEVIRNNVSLKDKEKIIEIAANIDIKLGEYGEVYLNNEIVNNEIRSKEVTDIVSQISSIPKVREYMVEIQRKMAENKDVIMEGRDITTVVFPNADYKFYLDADIDVRARRRHLQYSIKGEEIPYIDVYKNILFRDSNDMLKEVGALKRNEDQIYIDTSKMSAGKVVDTMLEEMKKIDEEKNIRKL